VARLRYHTNPLGVIDRILVKTVIDYGCRRRHPHRGGGTYVIAIRAIIPAKTATAGLLRVAAPVETGAAGALGLEATEPEGVGAAGALGLGPAELEGAEVAGACG